MTTTCSSPLTRIFEHLRLSVVITFIAIFSLAASSSNGQTELTVDRYDFTHKVYFLSNSELKRLLGGRVSAPLEGKQPVEAQAKKLRVLRNRGSESIWAAMLVSTLKSQNGQYFLKLHYPHYREVEVYTFEKHGYFQKKEHFFTGISHAFHERPMDDPHFIFPLALTPSVEQLIVFRVDPYATGTKISIINNESLYTSGVRDHLAKGFLIGILVFLILYNAFMSAYLKERIHGLYVCYMSCVLLYIITAFGYGFALIWPEFPKLNLILLDTTSAIVYVTAAIFVKNFLSLEKELIFRRFIQISIVISVALAILWLLPPIRQNVHGTKVLYTCQQVIFLVTNMLYFIFGIGLWIRNGENARYFVLAWAPPIVCATIFTAGTVGLLEFSEVFYYIIPIGAVIEAALFSFALGERIKKEQRQRLIVQGELLKANENYTKELENEVVERTRELAAKNEAVSENNKKVKAILAEKNIMFGNISHELRTPLSLILGPAATLREDESSQWKKDQLDTILRNSQRILRLVQQFFSLSQSNTLTEEDKLLSNVSHICDWVTRTITPLAEAKSQRIISDIHSDLWSRSIPDSVEKIVTNLMSNAIKYSFDSTKILIKVFSREDHVIIQVSDQGIGISPSDREVIFKRFARLQPDENIQGSGIGLSVVMGLTKANKGIVSLREESEVGFTSTFEVILPKSDPPVEKNPSISLESRENLELEMVTTLKTDRTSFQKSEKDKNSNKDSPQILIVDDNKDITEFLANILGADYTCVTFTNPSAALEYALEYVPDLILTDFIMPNVDGMEFTQKIKNSLATRHIPVVMITASTNRNTRQQRLENFVDEFVTKPFDIEEIRLLVKNRFLSIHYLAERTKKQLAESSSQYRKESRDVDFLDKVDGILAASYHDETLNLDSLCEQLALTARPLQRKFKSLLGCSPMAYVRQYRIAKAKDLLVTSDKSVTDIAMETGFNCINYFSRSFKEVTSMTPSKFRENRPES